jgi:4'-phosphopantetheinyl transferase EntD
MTVPEASYRVVSEGSSGIGSLLPRDFAAVEALGAVAPDTLFPDEEASVDRSVEKRKLEFARGRSCARRAMALLGVEPVSIPSEAAGAPVWPAGLIGSITHCRDYCCAALASSDRWSAIGIDAEVLQPIEPGTRDLILLPAEQRHLDTLDVTIPWAAVVFSAKEAIYKACYPLVRRWIDFHDVEVRLDPHGRFDVAWKIDLELSRPITGRFCLDGNRVIAAVLVERS